MTVPDAMRSAILPPFFFLFFFLPLRVFPFSAARARFSFVFFSFRARVPVKLHVCDPESAHERVRLPFERRFPLSQSFSASSRRRNRWAFVKILFTPPALLRVGTGPLTDETRASEPKNVQKARGLSADVAFSKSLFLAPFSSTSRWPPTPPVRLLPKPSAASRVEFQARRRNRRAAVACSHKTMQPLRPSSHN